MRALIILSVVATVLASCVSIDKDSSIHVEAIDHWSGSYNDTRDQTPFNVKSFSIIASHEVINGYGPNVRQAVLAISKEIVASHGFCPKGFSIGHSPHIGVHGNFNWRINCSEF